MLILIFTDTDQLNPSTPTGTNCAISFHPKWQDVHDKNKMFHPSERISWFSPRDRWLIDCRHTAPYPLTQFCCTCWQFQQYSWCQAEDNTFCLRAAIVSITSCCVSENYFQPWQPQNQTLLWGMLPFSSTTAMRASSVTCVLISGPLREVPLQPFHNSNCFLSISTTTVCAWQHSCFWPFNFF